MHASILGLIVALLGCAACSATEIVFNGAVGTWGAWDACPDNSYAAGMWTKSQADHGAIDDTAMNGVRLLCKSADGTSLPYTPQSSVGKWGTWDTPTHCPSGLFVVGFMVRFQECCSAKDDTALNRIIFICNNPSGTQKYYSPELGKTSWGEWSTEYLCPPEYVAGAIRTRVQDSVGLGDDTAMNGVALRCIPYLDQVTAPVAH
eukprot:m51a1_g13011 hypothetical protein (204) ;mRNA; f:751-1476